MANTCPRCGANLDLVGRSHRCASILPAACRELVALPDPTPEQLKDIPEVTDWTGAVRGLTYRYRDKAKRRDYMRAYMKRKRGK